MMGETSVKESTGILLNKRYLEYIKYQMIILPPHCKQHDSNYSDLKVWQTLSLHLHNQQWLASARSCLSILLHNPPLVRAAQDVSLSS